MYLFYPHSAAMHSDHSALITRPTMHRTSQVGDFGAPARNANQEANQYTCTSCTPALLNKVTIRLAPLLNSQHICKGPTHHSSPYSLVASLQAHQAGLSLVLSRSMSILSNTFFAFELPVPHCFLTLNSLSNDYND